MTNTNCRSRLIAFAVTCAADELDTYAQASSHPDPEPCEGMWQTFLEEFKNPTLADWDLVSEVYTATVGVLAARAGIELP